MVKVSVRDWVFLGFDSARTAQHMAFFATFSRPEGAPAEFCRNLVTRLRGARDVVAPFTYRLQNPRCKALTRKWEILPGEDIDPDWHVRFSTVSAPGGDTELNATVARLHSLPLDPARPLWEFHVLDGLSDGRFGVYFKVHHAMMDGMGVVERVTRMLRPAPDDDTIWPLWTIAPTMPENRPRTGIRTRIAMTIGVGRIAFQIAKNILHPTDPALAVPFGEPRSMFNVRIGAARSIATRSYDLGRLRSVAEATGVTLNEMLLVLASGALRRAMAEVGGRMPPLTAGVPVCTRRIGDATLGNVFTLTVMRLGTEIGDPVARVGLVSRSSQLAKKYLRELPRDVAALHGVVVTTPFTVAHLAGLGGWLRSPYHVVVSNVVGSPGDQYLAGARLETLYPVGSICHGMALFIAAYSAGGRFHIGFTADAKSIPDLPQLAAYTDDVLAELEHAVALHG